MRDLDCIEDMKLIAEGMVVFSFLQKHVVSAVTACFTPLTQSTQNASQQISLYFWRVSCSIGKGRYSP